MHSSRMHTVRCSGHLGGCLAGGCLARGSVCLGGVCLGVVCPGECAPKGVSAQRGCLPRGGVFPGGVHLFLQTALNNKHSFENITFSMTLTLNK